MPAKPQTQQERTSPRELGKMIRVLLVDDHSIVRRGIRLLIDKMEDIEVVAETDSAESAIQMARDHEFDVAMLDISMSGISGLEAIPRLKEVRPGISILILTMHPEQQYAVTSIRAGASGYLTKDRVPEEVEEAIRQLAEGGSYLTPLVSELLESHAGDDDDVLPHKLLSRESTRFLFCWRRGRLSARLAKNSS